MWGFPTSSDAKLIALCRQRKKLDACNLGYKKKRSFTIEVAKTEEQISCAFTAQLITKQGICTFVFIHGKIRITHGAAH